MTRPSGGPLGCDHLPPGTEPTGPERGRHRPIDPSRHLATLRSPLRRVGGEYGRSIRQSPADRGTRPHDRTELCPGVGLGRLGGRVFAPRRCRARATLGCEDPEVHRIAHRLPGGAAPGCGVGAGRTSGHSLRGELRVGGRLADPGDRRSRGRRRPRRQRALRRRAPSPGRRPRRARRRPTLRHAVHLGHDRPTQGRPHHRRCARRQHDGAGRSLGLQRTRHPRPLAAHQPRPRIVRRPGVCAGLGGNPEMGRPLRRCDRGGPAPRRLRVHGRAHPLRAATRRARLRSGREHLDSVVHLRVGPPPDRDLRPHRRADRHRGRRAIRDDRDADAHLQPA